MAAAAFGRLAQYLAGDESATWHVLVADEFHLEAGGPELSVRACLVLRLVCRRRNASLVEQNGRRRDGHMGRIRALAPDAAARDIEQKSRVDSPMDSRSGSYQHRTPQEF